MENSNVGEITLNKTSSIDNVRPYLEKNDREGATQFLREFLQINPANTQAMFILAQVLEVDGNYEEAAELYETVFKDEIPPEFMDRVLSVYEAADKYDKVYKIHKKIYNNNKDNTNICERFAHTCCILKKHEEAIEAYNCILSKQPDNIVALSQLSEIYEETNPMMYRLTSAKIALLEENFEKAEHNYKKAFAAAEKDEDILQIRYLLANLYRQMGKTEQALDEYLFILSDTKENFSVYMEIADIYLELSNLSAAIDTLNNALNVYPDNIEAMQLLADTYMDTENFEKAEEYYEKLVELNNSTENKVNLAKVYLCLDKMDKTKEILLSAEAQDSDSTEVLTAMAGYYTVVSDFEKAKNYCNRIIQKLPKSPLGYRKLAQLYEAQNEQHLAHYNYGLFFELKNETDEAINEYNQALSYKKDDFETVKRLAKLHETMKEFNAAADYYHMLFEAKIDYIETTKKIVNIYFDMQEYDIAQKYIDTAIQEENNIEFSFLNAKCMFKLKDYDGALENLLYYKENTKSLENEDEANKLIELCKDKKETSLNPLAKIFKFFGI